MGAVSAAQPSAQSQPPSAAISIARLGYVDGPVELERAPSAWARAVEGTELRIGDRLRTGAQGIVRIDFPWTSLTLTGDSRLSVPRTLVLATLLEEGRVEQSAPGAEILKLLTPEASIRGAGRVVVRRERGCTLVSALAGSFRVEAGGRSLDLAVGQGTLVRPGRAPADVVALPEAPVDLDPGVDPRYVGLNELATLAFVSSAPAHHLQVLGIDSEQALIERDVAAAPIMLAIPLAGTFRWRVAARDRDGLEGPPSREGLIAVVAR